MTSNFIKNICAIFLGIFIALLACEIFLHFFDPFGLRVRGGKIVLPVNKKYNITNNRISKLDKKIFHAKNSLGFRGDELPQNQEDYLSIIVVGGSTTECFYLSDGQPWPALLGRMLNKSFHHVWINNAGLDGQSTFGHIKIMKDYIVNLKPKMVLFYIGANDFAIARSNSFDYGLLPKKSWKSYSSVVSLVSNIMENIRNQKMMISHYELDLYRGLNSRLSPDAKSILLKQIPKEDYLRGYELRVKRLIEIARNNQIDPVLITQPILFGNVIDDVTKVNLGKINLDGIESIHFEEVMEQYNDVLRSIGKNENVMIIDLANEMPKSSRYYYDHQHFTALGAEKAAQIIYFYLDLYLSERFSQYGAGKSSQ